MKLFFFVPIFFIHVGMRLKIDAQLFTERGVDILMVIAVMLFVKFLPCLLLFFRGLAFRQLMGTTCLLAAPLTLVIAIIELAEKNGAFIDDKMSSVVITAGILASLIYPSISRRLLRAYSLPAPQENANHH